MGTMYISAAEVTSLPAVTGTYAKAQADRTNWNTDLGNIDNNDLPAVVDAGLMWLKTGTTSYQTAVVNFVKACAGTETDSNAYQGLNPFRHIGAVIVAADMVNMAGTTVLNNGQTLTQWVTSLPDKVIAGQTNWNTLRKTTQTSGHNWGAYARGSLLACGLWLSDSTIINLCINTHKRFLGDTTVANTFTASGSFQPAWSPGGYPTSRGSIQPASDGATYGGVNCEDASRGGGPPTITGAGQTYMMEAWDGALFTSILLYHNGHPDVFTWGNNALLRNVQRALVDYSINGLNSIYHHIPWFVNQAYGTSLSTTAETYPSSRANGSGSYLGGSGSSFLTSGGGGSPHVIPVPVFSLSRSGLVVTLTATGTLNATSGSVVWGDGSATSTVSSGGSGTASHTYASGGTAPYTVTMTSTSSTGDTASVTHTIDLTSTTHAPVIDSFQVVQSAGNQLIVSYSITAHDVDGGAITYDVDWGDGSGHATASTGSHTYSTPGSYPATFTMLATVTSSSLTATSPHTLTFTDPTVSSGNVQIMWVKPDGTSVPGWQIYLPAPLVGDSGKKLTVDFTKPSGLSWT